MENKADLAARKLRPLFWWSCIVAAPIFLLSYGKMFMLAAQTWPAWLTVVTVIAHLIVIGSLSMLHDYQSQQRRK